MSDSPLKAPFAAPSIAVRLAVSALVASSLILVIAGAILSTVYRESTERAFDNRLLVYATDLSTDLVSPGEAEQRFVAMLGDPRFDLPLSGWYWQVGRTDARPRDVRSSRSLVGATLNGPVTVEAGSTAQIRKGYVQAPDERWLRIVEREVDVGEEGRFIVRVAGPADEIDGDVRRFVTALMITFLLLGLSLGLTTLLQIRFGLAPLVMLRGSVSAIRRGESERISGRYPPDIAPLAGEINLLLDTNRGILERARTQVGNLAHALKTPLSVIVNEVDGSAPEQLAARVREQAAIMRDQVGYHLDRARAAALAGTLGSITEVEPVVAAFKRTFEKIYRDKSLTIQARVAAGARFRGERQDLEEMIGNLVDNACKWAATRVEIRVEVSQADNQTRLRTTIEDDGSGLPDEALTSMLQRGRRLDETKPGSGLGLSIVADLAALYGGSVRLEASEHLGGVRAVIDLPGDG